MTASPAPEPDLISAARQWFDAGFAVIPSHDDQSKRPFGPWREYQDTRPTWPQVEGWLASGRYTGIGVITGAVSGNAELLEVEGPADAAVERLARIVELARQIDEQYGETYHADLVAKVARGCVEQSAGGGLHIIFRVSDGPAKPNTKLAGEGTGPTRKVYAETRGEGGFVIVAPTPGRKGHPDGAAYLFLQGSSPDLAPLLTCEERDVLHMLTTLALDVPDTAPTLPSDQPPRSHLTGGGGTVDATSPFGDYRARTTWRDILTPHGWQENFTDRDGRTHWTRPGKDKRDGTSATTLEDGPLYVFTTSTDLPAERGLTKEYVHAHYEHGGDLSAASRALRAAGYGTPSASTALAPWEPTATTTGQEGAPTADEIAALRSEWVAEHLPRLDWTHLWADDTEEEWIVEPILAARRLVALYSAPKVGKSLLMLEIAAAIGAGRPMFGYPGGSTPRRTLYVDFENDPRGDTRARLIDMGYGPGDLDNLVMLSFPTLAGLDSDAGGQQLMAAVEHYGCEVVVIDTVSRAVKGEENENDTWLAFYRSTGLRLKQAGIALIRLDHSGKDATKGQRGGSAKSGDVDAIWQLRKVDEDVLELECDGARFPITEQRLTLRRLEGPLRHEVDGLAWKQLRDGAIDLLRQAKVPKHPQPSVRQAVAAIRAAGLEVKSGRIKADIIARYCAEPDSWTPTPMVGE